jgi:hypothetical protein
MRGESKIGHTLKLFLFLSYFRPSSHHCSEMIYRSLKNYTMSIFPTLLMLHLIALVVMAGTTVVDFVIYQSFWKLLPHQKEQAAGILEATANFPRLIGIGAGLLIFTGAAMIGLTHGVLAQQLWFHIKVIFVLLLIANGAFNGNRLNAKLRSIISLNAPELAAQMLNLRGRLRTFYLLQFCIFLIIIFLSAYKFN